MSKNVTASITFVGGGTNQLQAANGTFGAFAGGDEIMIEGTNQNNGIQEIVGVDAINQSYLTVSPGLRGGEGPITATVRAT
jgi:hypothetical protein